MQPLSRRARVLIVDDEQDIRELLSDFLESDGYQCLIASDATEALERFKSEGPIDLVMSDIRMPGKTGIELLGDIKKIDEDAMVVMISAVKDIETAIAAMSKGAYDYIAKPFKLNEVTFVIKKALEKRQLLLENKEYQKHLEKMVEARTMELRSALEELDQTYNFTLRALVTALDTRDTETQGHSLRVVRYTLILAELLGITDKQKLKIFEYGALLHDIGKIGIPDSILRKDGRLNPHEWEIMKRHPAIAYQILNRIKFLEEPSKIVLHHHEYFGGNGYPSGLKGEAIPLGSRIFAVADALDAMTSDRPYCKAHSFEEAAKELKRFVGRQFDPLVVKAFDSIDLKWWKEERNKIASQIRADAGLF